VGWRLLADLPEREVQRLLLAAEKLARAEGAFDRNDFADYLGVTVRPVCDQRDDHAG
jgi:hypothetical protein